MSVEENRFWRIGEKGRERLEDGKLLIERRDNVETLLKRAFIAFSLA